MVRKEKPIEDPFMNYIVKLVVWLNAIFALCVLVIFFIRVQEPAVLIEYWFKMFTAELLAMASIQITKTWKGKKTEDEGLINGFGGGYDDKPPV